MFAVGFAAPGNTRYARSLAREKGLAVEGHCRFVEIVVDMHVYTRLIRRLQALEVLRDPVIFREHDAISASILFPFLSLSTHLSPGKGTSERRSCRGPRLQPEGAFVLHKIRSAFHSH